MLIKRCRCALKHFGKQEALKYILIFTDVCCAEMKDVAETYANGPTRQRLKATDPRGWEEFRQQLSEHSGTGSALTLRGVQSERPSLYDLKDQLEKLEVRWISYLSAHNVQCIDY